MTAPDVIFLKSSDGQTFQLDPAMALESQTIKCTIQEDGCEGGVIPVPNVTGKILGMVIEYYKRHAEFARSDNLNAAEEGAKKFDAEFVKVEQGILFDLILAAHYLNMKKLLDLTCETVANMMKGKTPDEIRKTFSIENDYSPEEEEQIRKENAWAFE